MSSLRQVVWAPALWTAALWVWLAPGLLGATPAVDAVSGAGAPTSETLEAVSTAAAPEQASEEEEEDEVVIIIGDEEGGSSEPSGGDDDVLIIDDGEGGAEGDDGGGAVQAAVGPVLGGYTRAKAEVQSRLMLDTDFAKTGEDVVEWWNLGRLTISHKRDRVLRFYTDAWVRWGVVGEDPQPDNPFLIVNMRDPKWTAEVQLREAYVTARLGDFELHAGQRVYVWGKNEVLPPADVINPMDLRYDPLSALTGTKDGKVPVFALEGGWYPGELGLQLVVVPFFYGHKAFLIGRDFALAPPGSDLAQEIRALGSVHPSIEDELQQAAAGTEVPEESPAASQVALRAVAHQWGWDFAATAYFGWDRTPKVRVDPDAAFLAQNGQRISEEPELLATDPELRDAALRARQKIAVGQSLVGATYQRQWKFALEAEGVVGEFVLRGDMGFSPGEIYYTEGFEYDDYPTFRAVAGAEWQRGEEWFVSLSGFSTHVLEAPPAPLVGLEASDVDPASRDVVTQGGLVANARWFWDTYRLELSATGLWAIAPGDWLVNGQVSWGYWEPHDIRLGVAFLGGPEGSLAGRYDDNDFAYIEYRGVW